MAHIYLNTYTKPIPNDAKIVSVNGKKYAKFKNGKGEMVTAPLTTKGKYAGKYVLCELSKWSIVYRDEHGVPKSALGFTDKEATMHYACKLETDAEQIRCGYKPPEHKQLNRPLIAHLAEFKAHMLARGTSEKQALQTYNRILCVITSCRFTRWVDIKGSDIERYLSSLRSDSEHERGISARTNNAYLDAMKYFCKWLHKEQCAPRNPIEHLEKVRVVTDIRHERRALTVDECRKLLNTTAQQPPCFNMSGFERALLYRVALESGLRANEIRTLTIRRCSFQERPPTLTIEAGYSKHRKEDVQPIPANLAMMLEEYAGNRPVDGLLFPTMPKVHNVAKMLRRDLVATEIPYKDRNGRYVDFHALRHTFITNLARSGVHTKLAMDLARHSNINLTMAYYTHTEVNERATALQKLPNLETEDKTLKFVLKSAV